jgi:RNA polymerase sigma-70 factor (ECF subfamily)
MTDSISNIENELLVLEAQDGNTKSMEILVSRWQKKLWRHVFNMTYNRPATWDITQQCWLDIIKNIRKLNDPACFKAWIYRIATNKSRDWLKKKNKYQHICLDSVQLSCEQKQDELFIREIVKRLNHNSRVVMSLYYFEQLNISEISIALRIPKGTVKSRLFKARQELKNLWQSYFEE